MWKIAYKKEILEYTSSNIHVIVNYPYNSSNSHNISRDAGINKIFRQFTFHSTRHSTFFMVFRFQQLLQPKEVEKLINK